MDQANKLRDLVRQKNESATAGGLPGQTGPDKSHARVITITSGKGGVGKTNFTANLAVNLAKRGKRVVIVDADFGLANIEVLFGIIPKHNLSDVLLGGKTIGEVITTGPLGLRFVSGGSGLSELANVTESQVKCVVEGMAYLDTIADIILIDTGAGISKAVVNFIQASSETIIITTPEPTSITDAYATIKTVQGEGKHVPKFKIIVNRVDSDKEGAEVFDKLDRVCSQFLSIPLDNLGGIPTDNFLVKAVKRQEPVSLCFPQAEASRAIERIANRLINIDTPSASPDGIRAYMKRLVNIFNS